MKQYGSYKDLPIISFADAEDFDLWMTTHYKETPGIWIKYYKKNSGISSLNWVTSVPISLKYGWIDSQAKGLDEKSYLQKFTPRKKNSLWSKINR